ncbi:hypothetical protein DB792_04905 [Staphylococcus warneri]|uniref:hypothetical protein n=1 Tax=Staphylococcus pasteuri TaxID=45972 RepID=UPI000F5FDEC0|nr:hypothetical protein [Staphylococcus pasteuri]RQX28238.1 hypothetical protein DB792_04905 [Staphylococcus warneri]
MKKIIQILTIIALILMIGIAVIFGYSSVKNLTASNHQKKTETTIKESKDKDSKSNDTTTDKSSQQDYSNNTNQSNTQNSSQNNTNEQANTTNEEDPNNLLRFDKNGDGLISTSELTPEAQKLADEGKFQPVSDRMAQEWTKDKNNEDNSNSSNPKTINGRPAGDAGNEVNMSAKNANVDSENTEDEDDSEN